MYGLRRRGPIAYEDLMREMEVIEHQLLGVDSALAMNLMVLEAKIRERFQQAEIGGAERKAFREPENTTSQDLDLNDLKLFLPEDLPEFPTFEEMETQRKRKKTFETAGLAAALAVVTALGVFGLASLLQIALSWIA